MILIAITFGLEGSSPHCAAGRRGTDDPLGVLIHAGTGVVGLLEGAELPRLLVLSHDPVHGHELGIFPVETGVLVTVAGTMTALFSAFAERGR